MSNKINMKDIISCHFRTLCDVDDKVSYFDVATFFVVPILLAILAGLYELNLDKDLISLLVNFGAIFTALLLSVLVLVYDQEAKLDTAPTSKLILLKKKLLNQLYYNISYAIFLSIVLIVACFFQSILGSIESTISLHDVSFTIKWGKSILTPICVFVTFNLILTILMIVKRMNILLTSK
jgi:hypothetical protein